uniref:Uncharacterized protein n=1 Tax=Rosa chinensis TaxID=74649 RepID=A0A2P6RWX9_ROSCH|nr:hypothetical protein RchiOBHm_Chr2g0138541 [Rosa chinensis]
MVWNWVLSQDFEKEGFELLKPGIGTILIPIYILLFLLVLYFYCCCFYRLNVVFLSE